MSLLPVTSRGSTKVVQENPLFAAQAPSHLRIPPNSMSQPPPELTLAALAQQVCELQAKVVALESGRSPHGGGETETGENKFSFFRNVEGDDFLAFQVLTKEHYEKELKSESAWLPLPNSVIGQSIRWYLRSDSVTPKVVWDSWIWLSTFAIGVLLQIYVCRCLWVSLPDIEQNPAFCHNHEIGRSLQLCAVGVFLLSVGEAFNDIVFELLIVLRSDQKCIKNPDEGILNRMFKSRTTAAKMSRLTLSETPEEKNKKFRPEGDLVVVSELTKSDAAKAVCLSIVLVEAAVWIVVIVVGIKWLLSSETVSDLVHSSVAIAFVNDIDNLSHSAIAPATLVENLANEEYEIKWLAPNAGPNADLVRDEKKKTSYYFQRVFHFSSLNFSVPALVVSSVAVVYGLHAVYC